MSTLLAGTPHRSTRFHSTAAAFGTATAIFSTPNGTGGRGTVIDSSNNLWVVELNNNSGQYAYILKCTTGGSCSTYYTFPSGSSLGLSNNVFPDGFAEDSSGNFYITDTSNNVVWKLSNTGTASSPVAGTLTNIQSCPVASGQYSNPGGCFGVTVSASGVVYMGSNGPYVYKLTPNGSGGYISSTVYPPPGLLHRAVGIALDPTGALLYAADYTDNNQNLGNGLTGPSTASSNFVQFAASGEGFGSVAVGTPASSTLPLTFAFDTAGTLGGIAVLTNGQASLDFRDAGTGTCNTTTSFSTSCTVNVSFTPTQVGLRTGAVVLKNSSGTVIATAYVYGTGTGPLVNFATPTTETVDASLSDAEGLSGDPSGNLYVAASSATHIYKERLANGSYTQSQLTFTTNPLSGTQWVTVDAAGNLFFPVGNSSKILKETPNGSGGYTESTVTSSFNGGNEIAIDAGGNLYSPSGNYGGVVKETLQSNGTYVQSEIATSSANPWGVAVDGSGNVFYTGANNGYLYRLTPVGSSYVQTTLATGFANPVGIAIDSNGNIYVGNNATGGPVNKLTYNASNSGCSTSLASCYTKSTLTTGVNNAVGIWVDANDNVFIGDAGNNRVLKLDYSDGPTVALPTTAVGATSASTTVTVENVGSAALTFSIPTSGTNPAVSTNFGWTTTGGSACPALTTSSQSTGSLAAGGTCTLPIYFDPVSGTSDTGTLVLTDNSASGTTQTINLTGTATYSTPTVTGVSPSSGSLLGGTTVTITGTNLLGATGVSFGGVSASVISLSSTQAVVSSPAVSSPGTVNVQVSTPGGTTTISSLDDYVYTKATKTITFTQPTTPALQGSVVSLNATASNGDPVTFSIVGGTGTAALIGTQLTYTGAGTVIIEADSAATSTYFAAAPVQQTVTVNALTLSSLTATAAINPAIVGESLHVTVGAFDSQSQDAYFTGTVTLSCGGCNATLPGAYIYQLADAGAHTFSVTFNARGTYTITATSGSVSTQLQIAAGDAVWVADAAGTLVKLNTAGSSVTSTGTSGSAATYGGVAVDQSGGVWSVNSGGSTVQYVNAMGSGAASSAGGGLSAPSSVAVDGAGSVWVANSGNSTVSVFSNAGVAESPADGYGANYVSGVALSAPSAVAIDQTGGVWVTNKSGNTVTHIFGAAAPVVTPLAAATATGTLGTKP